jgi:predicted transposase/invertase (TIGR01784 family)
VDDSTADLTSVAHSHDGFFKSVFSEPEHARAFFKSHLPTDIAAEMDWPSLTVLPGSFVKTSLEQAHSDLLFSVRLGERDSLLYLLFEHQTRPDPAMPLRLLAYVAEILTRHHRKHGLPLPPVLPLVLHQGPKGWKVSKRFVDLFDLPDGLAPVLGGYLPDFQYALLDLTRFDPATEEDDTQLQVILQLMKLAREKELLRFFEWLARRPAEAVPESLLGKLLLYALYADSDLDVEAIYHSLSNNPDLEKSTMSIAEKLKAQGHQEGLSQGRLVSLRANVIDALEVRFGSVPAGLLEGIERQEDEAKLRQMHRHAIQCASIEAFTEAW